MRSYTRLEEIDKEQKQYIKDEITIYHLNCDYENEPLNKEITQGEIRNVLKNLKTKKSMGNDNIKNEMLKNGGEGTINILTNMFNKNFKTEVIPEKWKYSEIIMLHKKGDKEKLENKRGISISSNVGKAFERILNERIKPIIPYSEAQAGGRKGYSTRDQLFILHSVINQSRNDKKPLYLSFLDIEKAYDKCWLQAVMVTLWQKGIRGKIWRIINKLGTNLKAKIKTRFGLTRIIQIKDCIRQGGVLSVTEFSQFMDGLTTEIEKHNIGAKYNELIIAILLLMDDITLLASKHQEMQKLLNTTEKFAKAYGLKFNQTKCRVMYIGIKNPQPLQLYGQNLEICKNYTYLGDIIENDAKQTQLRINKTKKVETIMSTIMSTTTNCIFKKLNNKALLELYEKCIIPSVLYGLEAIPINTKTY